MRIEDARFAAATITKDGRAHRFDDVGDMVLFHGRHPDVVARFWVHDHDTEGWIQADEAFFAVGKAFSTPMGHGAVAFAAKARAVAVAKENDGHVRTLRELLVIAGRRDSKPGPLYELVRRSGP